MVLAGSTYPVFGKELTTAFSPASLLFLSEMMGGIFVAIFFGIVPILKKMGQLQKKNRLPLFISTLSNSILAPFLWFSGLHLTTAVNAELFSRAEMLFLILLSAFVIREAITKRHMLSFALILFGIACVALRGFAVGMELQLGDALIISSALFYAIGGIIIKKYLHGIQPEIIILSRAACAACTFALLLPFVEIGLSGELKLINMGIIMSLLGYSFISRFLGVYGFYQAIENLKVSTVSMAGTLTVVGGMIFASIYLGEHIHVYHIVGGTFIVSGVILAQTNGIHGKKTDPEHHIRQHYRHNI